MSTVAGRGTISRQVGILNDRFKSPRPRVIEFVNNPSSRHIHLLR